MFIQLNLTNILPGVIITIFEEANFMSLANTPSANRIHIAFFGKRNAGKSTLVNAVTNQEISVVSDVKGTTTDPVFKSMELLPLGPVVIIDTPGYDDEGELGNLRVKKTKQVLNKTDIAVLVVDALEGITSCEEEIIKLFNEKNINYIIVYNKSDLLNKLPDKDDKIIYVSAFKKTNIELLKEKLGSLIPENTDKIKIAGDFIEKDDVVILVTPIDEAAPKGRLILPQQQTIRDILDANAVCITVQDTELENALKLLNKKPKLVITDSQVFGKVNKIVPQNIALTSFSILIARIKGLLESAVKGASKLGTLKENDIVLISEGCTHHRQCNDIGTVKLPKMIENFCGKKINFEFSSGGEFPEDLSKYSLVIHCGGCMLNDKEMKYRVKCSNDQCVPITNYGTAIAYMNGILERSLEIIPEIKKILD